MATYPLTRRAALWIAAVLAALLLTVAVLVAVLIGTVNKQAEDAAYRACMERLDTGYSGSSVEEFAAAVAADAEICSR